MWCMRTTCRPRMKWESDPEDQSLETAILSKSDNLCNSAGGNKDQVFFKMRAYLPPNRLLFQCKYSGTAVEALVFEVNPLPPPVPVAAAGPLRVELRLASGQCHTKGCIEGE